MQVEYEAKFIAIKYRDILYLLKKHAHQVRKQFLQSRYIYKLPTSSGIKNAWIRIRDEDGQISLSLKTTGNNLEDQKELLLIVDNFINAQKFLSLIGCKKIGFQENKREIWNIGTVEITIDEWPFLNPFIEIESKSKKELKNAIKILGLDYHTAIFGAVDKVYAKKYDLDLKTVNKKMFNLTFSSKNPFY